MREVEGGGSGLKWRGVIFDLSDNWGVGFWNKSGLTRFKVKNIKINRSDLSKDL